MSGRADGGTETPAPGQAARSDEAAVDGDPVDDPFSDGRWFTGGMVTPTPEPEPMIDPNEPVPDDPAELLPDAPEPLPPAPTESTPDDPGGDTGGVPEPA